MKRFVLVFIVNLILNLNGIGQNLVPNPSFEVYDTCPYYSGGITFSNNWSSPNMGSPDYYNQCATSGYLSVPSNIFGFQYAHTGVAYVGIAVYSSITNGSEYVQVQLNDTLKTNHKYCVSFYVNLWTKNNSLVDVGITELGLLFSNNAITSTNMLPFPNVPQITSPVGVYLIDTANWMEISGIYTAQGGEKYITIGNFKNNTSTDTITVENGTNSEKRAYYYIDDVSVVDCTNVGIEELAKENEILISPNPATSSITITSSTNIKEIKLINLLGECVLSPPPSFKEGAGGWSVDISILSKGIYFVKITDEKKTIANRKIVVH